MLHVQVSLPVLRIYLCLTEGVSITVAQLDKIRAAQNVKEPNVKRAKTSKAVAVGDLWDTVWNDGQDHTILPRWANDVRNKLAMRHYVGLTDDPDAEDEEMTMPMPITRARCSVIGCVFSEKDYEMRWETDPRDQHKVMCRFHFRTVLILQ